MFHNASLNMFLNLTVHISTSLSLFTNQYFPFFLVHCQMPQENTHGRTHTHAHTQLSPPRQEAGRRRQPVLYSRARLERNQDVLLGAGMIVSALTGLWGFLTGDLLNGH